jgi:hypothetical protein
MKILEKALEYAKAGFRIIPYRKDGEPMSKKMLKEATTDPAVITQWWTEYPKALIGLPTGIINNMMVLDVDLYYGSETLLMLEQENSQLPATLCQRTEDGGYQYFFKHPGIKVKNYNKRLGLGLDIHGDGGYVIVPSSATTHRWISTEPIADAPNWLMALVTGVKGYQQPSDVVAAFCKKQGFDFTHRFTTRRGVIHCALTPEDGDRHDS